MAANARSTNVDWRNRPVGQLPRVPNSRTVPFVNGLSPAYYSFRMIRLQRCSGEPLIARSFRAPQPHDGRGTRPTAGGRPLRAGHPLVGPVHDLEGEATLATRGDHQPAACVGRIRLRMARSTERHQAVEVEVRAALGALPDVMHLEAVRGETAGLAPPPGAGQDLDPDFAPGLETRRGAAEGQRASGPDAAARSLSDPHAGGKPAGALHRRPSPSRPRGQKPILDSSVTRRHLPDFAHVGKIPISALCRRSARAGPPGAPTRAGTRGTRPGRWRWGWASSRRVSPARRSA